MKPVEQQIMHNPKNNQHGDCMRASIASLLELPYEEVPHFLALGTDESFSHSLKEFLLTKDLALLELSFWDWEKFEGIFHGAKGVHHLICGPAKHGTYHATVACVGVMVHDPHPSKDGLLWDQKHLFVYSFLVKI